MRLSGENILVGFILQVQLYKSLMDFYIITYITIFNDGRILVENQVSLLFVDWKQLFYIYYIWWL